MAADVREESFIATTDPFMRVVAQLKSPEHMAATIPVNALQRQLDKWEAEIAVWGNAILEKLGDTLRLRENEAELRDFVEAQQRFNPKITRAKAARLYELINAAPNQLHEIEGGSAMRAYQPCDEFGNEIAVDVPPDVLEELSRPQRDDRELRRFYGREHKKARGGVRDISPLLLRSSSDDDAKDRTNDAHDLPSDSDARSVNVTDVTSVQVVVRRIDNAEQPSRSRTNRRAR